MRTKKDFLLAAEIARKETGYIEREIVTVAFAQFFKQENPRFDTLKFVVACNEKLPSLCSLCKQEVKS